MEFHFMMMKKQQVAMLAIIGGIIVFSLKLFAYLVSDSIALLSDAMESVINIVASIMLLISLRIADRPEDEDHRYGHQKAENISAFVEGFLVIIAGALIIEASLSRILNPVELSNIDLGLVISLSATALNGVLSYVLLKEARKSGSIALEGDSKHLLSDVLSSVGVVLGLFVASVTGWYVLDPLLALVMAAIIIKMGLGILRKASLDLMDKNCPEAEEKIKKVVGSIDGYIEFHDLKTRKSGNSIYAEFHLCVSGDISVKDSHALTDRIESELKREVPGIIINIHIETEDQCCKGLRKAPP